MNIEKATPLVVSDGRTGGLNQSLGVAQMLGFRDPEVVTLQRAYKSWWLGWLPPMVLFRNLEDVRKAAVRADLVIGAGHGVSRVLRLLKAESPRLFTVALLRPSGTLANYDVVSVPKHDGLKPAPNLIITLGNCNLITKEKLQQEAQRWQKRLQSLQGFKLAVLVGGNSKHGSFTPQEATVLIETLVKALKAQASQGASLMVTTSRRTGEAATAAIEAALKASHLPHFLWRPDNPDARDNPYLAYLGLADAVLVTADSSSMVSEAASAGKPVYIWGAEAMVPKKFREFYRALASQGRVRYWNDQLNLRPPAAGMMDTMLVAGFIRAKWQKRFG